MDETRPDKLAGELERQARELERRGEQVGQQIDSARETWKRHRETAAPPAPDAPTDHTPEQAAAVNPPEEETPTPRKEPSGEEANQRGARAESREPGRDEESAKDAEDRRHD